MTHESLQMVSFHSFAVSYMQPTFGMRGAEHASPHVRYYEARKPVLPSANCAVPPVALERTMAHTRPFQFQPLSGAVQWKAVITSDIDRIVATNDAGTVLQRYQDVAVGDVTSPGALSCSFCRCCGWNPMDVNELLHGAVVHRLLRGLWACEGHTDRATGVPVFEFYDGET